MIWVADWDFVMKYKVARSIGASLGASLDATLDASLDVSSAAMRDPRSARS